MRTRGGTITRELPRSVHRRIENHEVVGFKRDRLDCGGDPVPRDDRPPVNVPTVKDNVLREHLGWRDVVGGVVHRGDRGVSRRRETNMEQAIGVRIDSGVQPISLSIELNLRFVDRNVIRTSTRCRL